MRRFTKGLLLSAVILIAGCIVAGCGSSVKSAIASISPTRSASASPGQSTSSSPSPSVSVSSSPSGIASSPSSTATATSQPPATSSAPTPTPTPAPTAPQLSGSPAAGTSSGSNLLWLWILLGALVLVGVIIWIVRAGGHRSAAAASWRSRVIDAYAKGSALHDAMSVAEAPGALAAADAGARWSDIQRRADDLTQTLYALREAAPDEETRGAVADVLASLQAVRSAMDAERVPGRASAQQAEVARERLAFFEVSLRLLRPSDQQAP
jgi:hypothetical protein